MMYQLIKVSYLVSESFHKPFFLAREFLGKYRKSNFQVLRASQHSFQFGFTETVLFIHYLLSFLTGVQKHIRSSYMLFQQENCLSSDESAERVGKVT